MLGNICKTSLLLLLLNIITTSGPLLTLLSIFPCLDLIQTENNITCHVTENAEYLLPEVQFQLVENFLTVTKQSQFKSIDRSLNQ